MNKKVITATAVLSAGILLLLTIVIGFQTKAKGEDDFRINGTILTAYVGTDTFASVPSTVTSIGEGAFAENTTLQSIELPEGLREIGYNAFGGCTALTSVTIPDSVTKVGPGAFKGCSALTLADLGAGISSWGSGVFNDCTSLSKVIVDGNNNYLLYYNGALYNGDMSMLYQVLAGRTGDSYAMPDEVKEIDTYAFWNQQNIKNVKVSPNVTKIPSHTAHCISRNRRYIGRYFYILDILHIPECICIYLLYFLRHSVTVSASRCQHLVKHRHVTIIECTIIIDQ